MRDDAISYVIYVHLFESKEPVRSCSLAFVHAQLFIPNPNTNLLVYPDIDTNCKVLEGSSVTVVAGNIYCSTLMYLGAHNLFHFSITITLISVGLLFLYILQ